MTDNSVQPDGGMQESDIICGKVQLSDRSEEVLEINDLMQEYNEMTRNNDKVVTVLDENVMEKTNEETKRGAIKRNRGVDQEEIWTTVSRKGKKFARSTDIDDFTRIPEDKVEVSVTCTEKIPKQFKLAKILREQKIQDVIQVKYINEHKVLLQFSNEESAEYLIACKLFNENGFRCQKTFEVNQSYGVINNIDLDLTDDEILDSLTCDTLILGIKRLKRRNTMDGRWIESESIRICFKGNQLPSHAFIFDTKIRVNPYIYPVTQCSNCWRFGHTFRTCVSSKPVCPKCGGQHQNCEKTDFKCNNCGGRHMALAKVCPFFIKERRIREQMAEYNISYKQVLAMYGTRPQPRREEIDHYSTNAQCNEYIQDQPKETQSQNTSGDTYAKITKTTGILSDKTKKTNKQTKKKKSLRTTILDSYDNIDVDMSSDSSEDETMKQTNSENKSNGEESISWKILLKKLKEKILNINASWEDKIKDCISIIFDKVVALVVHHMSDWSCLNFLNRYG